MKCREDVVDRGANVGNLCLKGKKRRSAIVLTSGGGLEGGALPVCSETNRTPDAKKKGNSGEEILQPNSQVGKKRHRKGSKHAEGGRGFGNRLGVGGETKESVILFYKGNIKRSRYSGNFVR